MKILVTGGAGYVGSTLIPRLLASGHDVRAVDSLMYGGRALLGFWAHPNFEFVRGDIRDPAVVRSAVAGVDAVVHLAAIVGDPACARDKKLAKETNLDASLDLWKASRAAGVKRFIFVSTCSNYGKMAEPGALVDESSELRPVSFYAETKVAVEREILAAERTPSFTPTILRFATVYGVGPRMRFDLTVNEFAMEAVTKKNLKVFGEQFWRPYLHVRDAARAIETVLAASPNLVAGEVFNVGSTKENFTKADIVRMLETHVPDLKVEYVHKNEDPRDYKVEFRKIQKALDFTTQHTVEEGLAEVVDLVRAGVITDFEDPRYRN